MASKGQNEVEGRRRCDLTKPDAEPAHPRAFWVVYEGAVNVYYVK
jgi:hypothetical protein